MGEDIQSRLEDIRRRIAEAATRAGRDPATVRLLAVSKGKPAEDIRAAYAAGQREFGENYAQELAAKADALRDLDGIVWHAIGRLQRNKAKQVARVARVFHALDRGDLALELDKRTPAPLDVMIEVNVSGEASKGGCPPAEVAGLLSCVRGCKNLRAIGLMTIPPDTDDPELARPYFAELRTIRDRHGGAAELPELSMGMTHDFPIAIAEGATIVRVGTAIFGARAPKP